VDRLAVIHAQALLCLIHRYHLHRDLRAALMVVQANQQARAFLARKHMFDQLAKAIKEKQMTEKTKRDYSNRGGEHSYDPGCEPDLGKEADYRDLNKLTPEQREKGYTTGLEVPFGKVKPNDRDA
jgi:hypothetical protein